MVLLHIKDLFGSGCISQRSNDGMERYTLSFHGYPKIVQYLSRFPLRGEKHILYKRWHRICIRLDDDIVRPEGSRRFGRLRRLVINVNKS